MTRRITYSSAFLHNWKYHISQQEDLVEEYISRLDAFRMDPKVVDDHELEEPMKDRRAFWSNNETGWSIVGKEMTSCS